MKNPNKITWRKPERPMGAYGWLHQRDGHDLCVGGMRVVYVRGDRDRGCWYWYGWDNNTLWNNLRFPTMEEAKAHARKYVEDKLARGEKVDG